MATTSNTEFFKTPQFKTITGKKAILAGVATGQIAGLIMAFVMMVVYAAFLNQHLLYPVQIIGSTLLGEEALIGFNWSAIFTGLVLHQLGPALFWGLAFGSVAKFYAIQTVRESLALGFLVGVVAMIVDVYYFVPIIMNYFNGVNIWAREVPLGWDWAAHLVFGFSFGLYPPILKKLRK